MRTVLSLAAAGLLAVAVWQLLSGNQHETTPEVVVTPSETRAVDPALDDALVPPIDLGGVNPNSPAGLVGHGPSGSHTGLVSLLDTFNPDPRASFHPHGEKVCASGCAASNHPTETLTRERFEQLLRRYAVEPMDETSLAFETLLYFGRQTRDMLGKQSAAVLDPLREEVLRLELDRTHVKISIRLVDEEGEVRANLPPTKVPFDRRHEFTLDTHRVQPLITSGTIKRVGLYHLWTRL
jgi:hypothetical protein